MRVMITGGAGFIGSAVCRHFILELGHDVVNVDKLTYAGNLASLTPVASSPHYAFEKLDICDADGIRAVFSKYQPAAVVHLAAESHVDRSISGSNVFVQMWSGLLIYSKPPANISTPINIYGKKAFVSSTFRQTKSTGRSARADCSAKQHPTTRARPIRRQRRLRITSPKPGTALTVCQSSSRIARTIMDPISFLKS